MVWRQGVDVPYWDQWKFVAPYFTRAAEGTLSLADFFEQTVDSRIAVPKALFLGLGWFTGWNVRYEMFLTQLIAIATLLGVARLATLTAVSDGVARRIQLLVVSLMIFSPMHLEVFLWGIALINLIPPACLVGGLVVAYSAWRLPWKLAGGILISSLATYSYSSGLMCWGLLPAALFVREWPRVRSRRWPWLVWLAAAAANLGPYFHGFVRGGGHPPLGSVFEQGLLFSAMAFCSFFGGPLRFESRIGGGTVAFLVGATALAGFALCAQHLLLRRGRLLEAGWPWLVLGAYSLVSGLAVTVARIGWGAENLLAGRYGPHAIWLSVALVFLAPLCLWDVRERASARGRRTLDGALLGLLAGALLLIGLSYQTAWPWLADHRTQRLHGKAALLLIESFHAKPLSRWIHPEPAYLRQQAQALDRLGLLRPPLFHRDFAARADLSGASVSGAVERSRSGPGGSAELAGWAVWPDPPRAADAIVFTYRFGNSEPVPFDIAFPDVPRPDLPACRASRAALACGWQAQLALPGRGAIVEAWALDAQRGRPARLF